jgi:dolichol-phosphate mannosyltransferase
VDTLLAMREKNAFFRALSSWIGFETAQVEFEVQPRLEGESKWSFLSLVRYAVTNIVAFTTAPLQMVTLLGVGVFGASVLLGIWSLWQKFTGRALEGFTTVILLQLIIGSILMICLGIIGYYIAKIYEEVKDRPRYILSQSCGGKESHAAAEEDR